MSPKDLIPVNEFCNIYEIEFSFINELDEYGLIEITRFDENAFIERERIKDIEKIIRLHNDLGVNFEGIDIINNLLERISMLENKLYSYQNRLSIFED